MKRNLAPLFLCWMSMCPPVAAGQEPAVTAAPIVSGPTVPDTYLLRWVPEEKFYDEAGKVHKAMGERPDAWMDKKDVLLLCQALSAGEGKFVNYELLEAQQWELDGRNEESTPAPEEKKALRKAFRGYLQRMAALEKKPGAPANLAWHGMACSTVYHRLGLYSAGKMKLPEGAPVLTARTIWQDKVEKNKEPEVEYRVNGHLLLVMKEWKWRLYDFRSGKWRTLPEVRGGERFYESGGPYYAGLSEQGVATVRHALDFKPGQWRDFPESPGRMEKYLDDPVRSGSEWVIFYENPPHYDAVEGTEGMSKEKKAHLVEFCQDRFYFLRDDGTMRDLSPRLDVDEWGMLPSGRLFVAGCEVNFRKPCQVWQTLLAGEDVTNKTLPKVMEGNFNGHWRVWHGAQAGEALVLEQGMDYENEVPVRAAVWDVAAKKWELLWNDAAPQMPPPPPGVLAEVLKQQQPRWELPAALTRAGVGEFVNCLPLISRNGEAFLFVNRSECLTGNFGTELWHFRQGKREPECCGLKLPGGGEGEVTQAEACETGFVLSNEWQIWHLPWKSGQEEEKQ